MPTITRQLVDGPSREELFDALRLHAEGRVVNFDVAQPKPESILPMGDGTDKTAEELLELAFRAMPRFPARISGISVLMHGGDRWIVTGVLDESRYTAGRTITLKAHFNTKNRRESGDLVVSWTTESEARSA
jgi:hypothetical protein